MERKVGALEARRNFGKLLDAVTGGDTYIVARHSEPAVAIVPMYVYQKMQRDRAAFFDAMREASENANLSPEEADALAEEAVQAVRAAKRKEDSAGAK